MGKGRDSKAAKKKRDERRGETRAHGEAKAEKNLGKQEKRQANKKDEDDLDALLAEFKAMQCTTKRCAHLEGRCNTVDAWSFVQRTVSLARDSTSPAHCA